MSHIITNQVRELKTGNQTAKSVLFRLADYANDAGECFPSTTRIADELEVSRQAVSKAIQLLEKMGLIKVNHARGRHNSYQITPENYKFVERKINKPVKVDDMQSTLTGNSSLQGCNPSLHEPVNDVDTNHHRTINNHHSGGVNACEENLIQLKSKQVQSEFVPVNRKFMIGYFPEDDQFYNFENLENHYFVEQHFQVQAQTSFPELEHESIELIFNEYKRFWLDNHVYKLNPQKWMTHWISRVEKRKSVLVKCQAQHSQTIPEKQKTNYSQHKQDNINRWKNHAKTINPQNTVIDVYPNDFLIGELGHA